MGLTLTSLAQAALDNPVKTTNLVLSIDGVGTLYGASVIKSKVKIGDGHVVGDPTVNSLAFYVGGFGEVKNQENVIMPQGTSTSIKQQLDPFQGQGTSVSTLSIALLDTGSITEIITPGLVVEDIIQRQAIVQLGFEGTSFPEDYVTVFRGFITSINSQPGAVIFQLNGTDEKKRTSLYRKAQQSLTAALTASDTTGISLDNYQYILTPIQGPTGSIDPTFSSYVVIDDEIIQFTGITTKLTGITRGAFGTTPAAHDVNASVKTFYRLQGNAIDIALKLMASGSNSGGAALPAYTSVPFTSVNTGSPDYVANSLFFAGVDLDETYGVTAGDVVTFVAGSQTGFKVTVLDVVQGQAGDFLVINQTLTDSTTGGSLDLFSQYNVLPDGCQLLPDQIDIAEHVRIQQLFLSAVQYDIYLKDTIDDARNFIEQNLYLPASAYSLPRKARSSVGYQIGPLPGVNVVTFNQDNIKSPSQIQVQRSTNTNFYNEIVYKYDEDPIEDQYDSGFITVSASSESRIKNCPYRTLTIEAKGLRSSLNANAIIQDQSARRLTRYQYGAEQFTFSCLMADGFAVEIGDIIQFDGRTLKLPDIKTGQVGIAPRLLEVTNKEFQLKTGDIRFTAVDTNFDGQARYGLISPSSILTSIASNQEFAIGPSFNQRLGQSEYKKWLPLVGYGVRVRTFDSSQSSEAILYSVSTTNMIRLKTPLSFTPTAGMILEFVPYSSLLDTAKQKLIYASFSPASGHFPDGTNPYVML